MKNLDVVLPLYNEHENIAQTVENLFQAAAEAQDWRVRAILVDDGSRDDTPALLRRIAESDPRVLVIRHEVNRGYGDALISGFKAATAEYTAMMDSDGQFAADDLFLLCRYLPEFDIVAGIRVKRADPLGRVLLGKIGSLLGRLMYRTGLQDLNCGLKVFRTELIQGMNLQCMGAGINLEIFRGLASKAPRIKQIPVRHLPRVYGNQTGASIKVLLKLWGNAFSFLGSPSPGPIAGRSSRIKLSGKFFWEGDEKFYVRGVTYGPFRPDDQGDCFPDRETLTKDLKMMADLGINTLRTYTVPPARFFDILEETGLRVLVGIPWEQHIVFLDDPVACRSIKEKVAAAVRTCVGRPSVLGFTIGNEIPSSIVRWSGPRKIEKFLYDLYRTAKAINPESLVSYVNFPTTEYLDLPFLDFFCFNIFLERRNEYENYLQRVQNIAGEKPLIISEVGLDSISHGVEAQAACLEWQLQATFAKGAAGAFLFSWTDDWHRGGVDITDWGFGLFTRQRAPKPAVEKVRQIFTQPLMHWRQDWPLISVVVCSHNGAKTLAECLDALTRMKYSNCEVFVVNDGSTDRTAEIARGYPGITLINVEHSGLSASRNVGLAAAKGDIVAFVDDDTQPDPHWLFYIADSFLSRDFASVGGPNIVPDGQNAFGRVVNFVPGLPTHVLLSDDIAEHIPGCNMAFRKSVLMALKGFDKDFRIAGDDVDLCWRIQEIGGTIGYHPAAVVHHYRRDHFLGFLRQQFNYGKAEAFLEKKWPEKYNRLGHVSWMGWVYSPWDLMRRLRGYNRIYHGKWGLAPFQFVYSSSDTSWWDFVHVPEWYLCMLVISILALTGLTWSPLLVFFIPLALSLILLLVAAARRGRQERFSSLSGWEALKRDAAVTALCGLQPPTRLLGRLSSGLVPWRSNGFADVGWGIPARKELGLWLEKARETHEWLSALEGLLRDRKIPVYHGGPFDNWDLEVRTGMMGGVRISTAIEYHEGGKQLARFRLSPRFQVFGNLMLCGFGLLLVWAVADQAWFATGILAALTSLFGTWYLRDLGCALQNAVSAVQEIGTRWRANEI